MTEKCSAWRLFQYFGYSVCLHQGVFASHLGLRSCAQVYVPKLLPTSKGRRIDKILEAIDFCDTPPPIPYFCTSLGIVPGFDRSNVVGQKRFREMCWNCKGWKGVGSRSLSNNHDEFTVSKQLDRSRYE